ncbi:MAG: hypothetical protein CMO55_04120 [Verrucomicrobiales bacterium]|nr:hypothetical protein [Verrucomicrobiales bacterium]
MSGGIRIANTTLRNTIDSVRTPSTILLLSILLPIIGVADDIPDRSAVLDSMKKGVLFLRTNLSVGGGYASEWSKDRKEGRVEHGNSSTVISIQPPGTTTLGLTFVEAYRATDERLFVQAAREAAKALVWCQLSSGGWEDDFDFDMTFSSRRHYRRDVEAGDVDPGKRAHRSTLDDNKTQSALLFLLEYAQTDAGKEDEELAACLEFAWKGLLAAQYPNGAWPQQFDGPAPRDLPVVKATIPETWPREWPHEKYTGFYTLNDGNLERVMHLLLRAYELTGEARFIDSAKKLGDFLLLAQFEGSQPAWSQQYDENMQPVWARKFEPPALSSTESYSAIVALFRLWIATGEDKCIATLGPALDWLEKSQLEDGKWARFYELNTNKPLYCVAETYELTYDDSNTPSHYGFKISSLENKIERMREDIARPHEEAARRMAGPTQKESWEKKARGVRGKVKDAMESQNENGCWYSSDKIDATIFVKNLRVMAEYLDALNQAEAIKN